MLCPKCKIYATKEVALFSSVGHICPSCDGGPYWQEYEPITITLPSPLVSGQSFTITRDAADLNSPYNEAPAKEDDEIIKGRLGRLGSYTVPKSGTYIITMPAGITIDLEKLKPGPVMSIDEDTEDVMDPGICWGGICDMP